MKRVTKFEIFYSDGSVRTGITATDWAKLPKTGVQFVVALHDDGSQLKAVGYDHYSMINGCQIVGDYENLRAGYVKVAEYISDEAFAVIEASVDELSTIWNR